MWNCLIPKGIGLFFWIHFTNYILTSFKFVEQNVHTNRQIPALHFLGKIYQNVASYGLTVCFVHSVSRWSRSWEAMTRRTATAVTPASYRLRADLVAARPSRGGNAWSGSRTRSTMEAATQTRYSRFVEIYLCVSVFPVSQSFCLCFISVSVIFLSLTLCLPVSPSPFVFLPACLFVCLSACLLLSVRGRGGGVNRTMDQGKVDWKLFAIKKHRLLLCDMYQLLCCYYNYKSGS